MSKCQQKIKLQPKKIPNANALLFWRCFKWLVHHANSKFCSNVKKSSLNSSQFAGIVNLNLPTYIHSLRKPHTNHRETRPLAIKPISADCVVVSLKQVTTRAKCIGQGSWWELWSIFKNQHIVYHLSLLSCILVYKYQIISMTTWSHHSTSSPHEIPYQPSSLHSLLQDTTKDDLQSFQQHLPPWNWHDLGVFLSSLGHYCWAEILYYPPWN